MSSRLSFDFAPHRGRARRLDDESSRVLVIADLSGAARRPERTLASARIDRISVDDFEAKLRRLQPRVSIAGAAGSEQTLTFESITDFHPDQLYDRLELSAAIPPAGRDSPAVVAPQLTAAAVASGEASDFARLLGRAPAPKSSPAARPAAPGALDQLLRDLVAPHLVPEPALAQPGAEAAILEAKSDALRRVLHAPAFQRLEASWRGLRWLVFENALAGGLEVFVLDASRADLVEDLRACGGELERSQLYRLLVQAQSGPDGVPLSLVIGDYTFGGSDEDVSLLAGLGAAAAQAGGCFLGGAEPELWGARDLAREPERGFWSKPEEVQSAQVALLRASAVAPFIGLCMPRVLGRVPYGERSDPIDRFDFSELPPDPEHEQFLWINAAYACAQLILAGVAERGWDTGPGSVLDLGDLPHARYQAAGGNAIKPCAEVHLDEASAAHVLHCGLMPLMSYRNRNAVRLARLQSIASPAASLALRSTPR
jgi:type VI secretion system protein ImpC